MNNTLQQSEYRIGILSALVAYTWWGLFPLYFIQLREVAPLEVLLLRILFAVPVGALIIHFRHQWTAVLSGLRDLRVLGWLALAAFMVATNWFVYIDAVQSQHIFEASLGYYINPLIYVLVGVVFFRERLSTFQTLAVALATIGVLLLTGIGGVFPWISLKLAITFTIYGVIRKQVNIGAMPGLFIETMILAPIAAFWLSSFVGQNASGIEQALNGDLRLLALLAFAGPATVIPLLFFAIATRRLPLSTIGFLQFLGPTLQFFVGLADGQAFTLGHQLCFAFIWSAVGIFAFDAWRTHSRKSAIVRPE